MGCDLLGRHPWGMSMETGSKSMLECPCLGVHHVGELAPSLTHSISL